MSAPSPVPRRSSGARLPSARLGRRSQSAALSGVPNVASARAATRATRARRSDSSTDSRCRCFRRYANVRRGNTMRSASSAVSRPTRIALSRALIGSPFSTAWRRSASVKRDAGAPPNQAAMAAAVNFAPGSYAGNIRQDCRSVQAASPAHSGRSFPADHHLPDISPCRADTLHTSSCTPTPTRCPASAPSPSLCSPVC